METCGCGTHCNLLDYAGNMYLFAFADLRLPGVEIEQTWQAMSLRASATDHIHYTNASVPSKLVVPVPYRYREHFRDPATEMINHRYREDWVAISVMWLGAMATGLVEAAFREAIENIQIVEDYE